MSHFWPEQQAIARFYTNSVTAGVTESICCFLNRHPRRVTCEPLFSSSTMCDRMLLSVSLSQCLAQSERSDVFFFFFPLLSSRSLSLKASPPQMTRVICQLTLCLSLRSPLFHCWIYTLCRPQTQPPSRLGFLSNSGKLKRANFEISARSTCQLPPLYNAR